jgi:hypothetical protein
LESELKLGPDTDFSAVERVSLSDAQYTLVGRLGESGAEYAWVQPGTVRDVSIRVAGRDSDGKPTPFCSDTSPLPLRTNWIGLGAGKDSLVKAARDLEQFSSQLGTIAALHKLVPGEAEGEFPYQLGLKRVSDGSIVREGKLIEDEVYDFILTADPAKFSPGLHRQFVYVFVMYCSGEAHLWFPTASNSGEQNHLPLLVPGQDRWPLEIPLNVRPRIVISGPFGQDTYFLVTSEERIRDLNVFEFEPVVTRAGEKDISTSVSSIFRGLGSTTRRSGYTSSSAWSIQRLTFQSVPKDAAPGTQPK